MNSVEYVQQFPLKEYNAGEMLLQKGDSLDCLMAIREGFVKITSITDTGIERLLWIAGRYDVLPTEQLFSKNAKVKYFYTALTNGTYYAVDKKSFLDVAFENSELMNEVARGMSAHYDDLLDRIDSVDTATVKERLVRTLCYLAERLSGSGTVDLYEAGLRLTHQDLAAMIGSTRETTSLTLNELRQDKLIQYNRKQFVVNVDRLLETVEKS